MDSDDFWAQLVPHILTFLTAIIPLILGWIAYELRCFVKARQDKWNQETLHSAIKTGVMSARSKYGEDAPIEKIIEYTVNYAHKSSPGAMKEKDPPADVLATLVRAKDEERRSTTMIA